MNNDREHLRILALLHFVWAGVLTLGLCLGGVWGLFFMAIFNRAVHDASLRGQDLPPRELLLFVAVFWFVLIASLLTYLACVLFAGYSLRARRHRTFCLIVAALSCLSFPLGTALGVFTILVLARDSVRESFADVSNVAHPS